jgi:thiamine-phosphate pyrophosphorylase
VGAGIEAAAALPRASVADLVAANAARAGQALRSLAEAAAVGADGVHTGADDLPTTLARRVIGPGGLLGRTAHDLAEAHAAAGAGADYLGIGPCFPSATKAFGASAPRGFLEQVARTIALPSYAIGGITLDRLDELAALGIRRVAVGSAVTAAADPAAAARALIERLEHLAAARLGG